jgi:hypothetical protein
VERGALGPADGCELAVVLDTGAWSQLEDCRDWLRASLGATAWAAGRATFATVLGGALGLGSLPTAQAQGMLSGKLLSLSEMLDPIVAGAPVVRAGVHIETLILADNGLSVFMAKPLCASP